MKIGIMGFCAALLITVPGRLHARRAAERLESLDSLASVISRTGIIPRAGELPVLAASCGWYGPLTGLKILPGDSIEIAHALTGPNAGICFFGTAPWSPRDLVVITAPQPRCIPRGLQQPYRTGSEAVFRLEGIDSIPGARVAFCSPDLEVGELEADSAGYYRIPMLSSGVHWGEVMRSTDSGPEIVLLFPLLCDGDVQAVFDGGIPMTSSGASSAEEVFRELNRLRSAAGLRELERDPDLDSLAAIRASNLAMTGTTTHFGPRSGDLGSILPPEFGIYGENIGRGFGYSEAWSMILISPFHLMTCLSSDYTMGGLAGAIDSGRFQWELVLVQVFASEEEPP